jgi:hypothetical protein
LRASRLATDLGNHPAVAFIRDGRNFHFMKTKSKPHRPAVPIDKTISLAARRLGGQPETDADARAAGLRSATSGPKPGRRHAFSR